VSRSKERGRRRSDIRRLKSSGGVAGKARGRSRLRKGQAREEKASLPSRKIPPYPQKSLQRAEDKNRGGRRP